MRSTKFNNIINFNDDDKQKSKRKKTYDKYKNERIDVIAKAIRFLKTAPDNVAFSLLFWTQYNGWEPSQDAEPEYENHQHQPGQLQNNGQS